jgi:hypothetical protein
MEANILEYPASRKIMINVNSTIKLTVKKIVSKLTIQKR